MDSAVKLLATRAFLFSFYAFLQYDIMSPASRSDYMELWTGYCQGLSLGRYYMHSYIDGSLWGHVTR